MPKLLPKYRLTMTHLNCDEIEGVAQAITDTDAKILDLTIYFSNFNLNFNPLQMMWSLLKYFIRPLSQISQKLL